MSKNDEIIQRVTAEALRQLREGKAPWRKPWGAGKAVLPTSFATGKPYRGINALLLALAGQGRPGPNLWLTYKQAQALGGQVRKGEKGTTAVFWKMLRVEDKATGEDKTIPLLRTFTVFHASQVDDLPIPAKWAGEREAVDVPDALAAILEGYKGGPVVTYKASDSAFYSPSFDTITMPELSQFATVEGHAETLLHELTHSTGHASRLGRFGEEDGPAHFGSPVYAKEELVAEIGAWLLAAHAGINLDDKQAGSYVAGWLGALNDDPAMLVWASQRAQKAVDHILGTTVVEEVDA